MGRSFRSRANGKAAKPLQINAYETSDEDVYKAPLHALSGAAAAGVVPIAAYRCELVGECDGEPVAAKDGEPVAAAGRELVTNPVFADDREPVAEREPVAAAATDEVPVAAYHGELVADDVGEQVAAGDGAPVAADDGEAVASSQLDEPVAADDGQAVATPQLDEPVAEDDEGWASFFGSDGGQDGVGDGSDGRTPSTSSSSTSSNLSNPGNPGDSQPDDDPFGDDASVPAFGPFRRKEEFFSYLLLRGPGHFTERTFNIAREFINDGRPDAQKLPGLTTVRDVIEPRVMRTCGLPLCLSTTEPVFAYVLPSAHVQRDFMFEATYNRFFIAEDRAEVLRELEPEFYDAGVFQNKTATLSQGPDLPCFGIATRLYQVGDYVDVVLEEDDEGGGAGRVLHQAKILTAFFAGRAAGLPRNHRIHAGDFVATCSVTVDEEAGHIVGRHWRLPFLDGFVWLPGADGDGDPVQIAAIHPSVRTSVTVDVLPRVDRRRAVRVGDTVTVPLAFYSDDFICRVGRNASAGAVYMLFPGLQVADRVSQHAVRTISVTPAGASSDLVLMAITDDLAVGTTTGWKIKDYAKREVLVKADVAFFVADYMQVSKTSRLRGHQALAPCSFCGFKQPGGDGSQYAGAASAADFTLRRTTPRTEAVLQALRDFQGE